MQHAGCNGWIYDLAKETEILVRNYLQERRATRLYSAAFPPSGWLDYVCSCKIMQELRMFVVKMMRFCTNALLK